MPELARLTGTSYKGSTATLVLTDSDLTVLPDPAFRAEVEEAFHAGRTAGEQAPRVIGWFVEKVVGFAAHVVEKMWEPHPLGSVNVTFSENTVNLHMGRLNYVTEMTVEPEDAYIFDAKFRQAKAAAAKR